MENLDDDIKWNRVIDSRSPLQVLDQYRGTSLHALQQYSAKKGGIDVADIPKMVEPKR